MLKGNILYCTNTVLCYTKQQRRFSGRDITDAEIVVVAAADTLVSVADIVLDTDTVDVGDRVVVAS